MNLRFVTNSKALAAFALVCWCGTGCPADENAETAGTSEGNTIESSDSDSEASTQSGDGDNSTTESGELPDDCTPELEALRADIFEPSCALAGCHDSTDAVAGLDLSAADLEAELVGQLAGTCDGWIRVVPGVPTESLLYAKVAGPAPCGALMPPPDGLSPAQVACLGAWIEGLEGMSCETCGGDSCVDLDTDAAHCGTCDNTCPDAVPCNAGECTCPDGQELCDGACINTSADPQNCGGCGNTCDAQVCWMGVCADTCAGLTDCDGACVDTSTDPQNCGGCGNTCEMGNACEMGGCGCPGDGVDFVAEVEPLLVDSCAGMGCHGSPVAAAGLDLRTGVAHGELVNVPSSKCGERTLVVPGQPGESYLMNKLLGVDMCFGTQMPKAAPPLSAEELATISEWICRGAAQ